MTKSSFFNFIRGKTATMLSNDAPLPIDADVALAASATPVIVLEVAALCCIETLILIACLIHSLNLYYMNRKFLNNL